MDHQSLTFTVFQQREFNHSGTAQMSAAAAKANNNRQQQATSKASYAGPTATEEARAAAKKVRNQGADASHIDNLK